MGIRLIVEVLDHAPDDLTWRERWALGVLAENANEATRECWPGIEDDPTIAHRMRLSARSSRYEVLKALRSKGVLETVSSGHRGHRAVYRIAALAPVKGPGTSDPIDEKGSGNDPERVREPRTQSPPKGPETPDPIAEKGSGNDFERVREPIRKGPGTSDPFPSSPSDPSASKQETPDEPADLSYGIPTQARPLVDALRAANINVRWPFKGNQWFPLLALIAKTGVPAMVDHAVKVSRRTDVESAKYFISGWAELAPQPAAGTPPPTPPRSSGRHQPFEPTPDHSAYRNGF
ncbi:hypothetical protein [Streptomyces sp. NPDC050738]|uniref:hypothetical protein n=1 Tax=Streptomyces sp. NPDC050738 TaxID=3154744 RepID=UPI0034490C38